MNSGTGVDVMRFANARRPTSVTCPVCGRGYGTASISIHLKACTKRFEEEEARKPKHERRKLPSVEIDYSEQALKGMGDAQMEQMNNQVFKQYNEAVLSRCGNCGRTFLPDRLAVHQRSCTSVNPARAVADQVRRGAPGGGATTYGAQVASSMASPQGTAAGSSSSSYDERPIRRASASAGQLSAAASSARTASPSRPPTAGTGIPQPRSSVGHAAAAAGGSPRPGSSSATRSPSRSAASQGAAHPAAPQPQLIRTASTRPATHARLASLMARLDSLQEAFLSEMEQVREEVERVLEALEDEGREEMEQAGGAWEQGEGKADY